MTVVLDRKPDEDVAEAIELAIYCQDYNCLPRAGGVLDQDAYHMWILMKVKEAQFERNELERKKLDKK